MIIELVLIAVLIGWVSGGKFFRLVDAKIKYGWLVFVALGLYVAAEVLAYAPPVISSRMGWFTGASHIAEKLMLIVMVLANIRIPGAKLILLGMVLNFIALSVNGWIMPASESALVTVFGADYVESVRHLPHVRSMIMDKSCELGFLCDIIAARRPFVFRPAVCSIGDLIMSVGVFIAIISLMRKPLPDEKKVTAEAQIGT